MKKLKISIWLMIIPGISFSAFTLLQQVGKGSHEVKPEVKAAVLKVLDEYMNSFNAKDPKAWQDTYHFPHFRLASGKMSVLEKYGDLDPAVFTKLTHSGWDYSKWDHRNIVQGSDTKVHVDTRFSRYNKDSTLLGTYESLYVVTKKMESGG